MCVPEVAPTTSISNPVVVVVPRPAAFTSKLIPMSVKVAVPEPGTVLSKSTCNPVTVAAATSVKFLSRVIPVIPPSD